MTMRIALCDDDINFLNRLRLYISEICDSEQVDSTIYTFQNEKEFLCSAYEAAYDIILLDIDMPNINGKNLAQELRNTLTTDFKLIFVSDYYEEVFSTFKYEISSFIPKSQIDELLKPEIIRILRTMSMNRKTSFSFRYLLNGQYNDGIENIDEITYVESLNGKIVLHTISKEYILIHSKYGKIVEQLKKNNFIDIHRTILINLAYLSSIEKESVVLKNIIRLPMSRRKRKEVKNAFFEYIKEMVIE